MNSAPAATTHSDAPARDPLLQVEALTAGYGRTTVLRDVTLNFDSGSVTAVLGANGAGKTTLLRCLSGLIRATSGTISMGQTDVSRLPPHRRLKQGICLIPEGRGVFKSLTVAENLRLHRPNWQAEERTDSALEIFPALRPRLSQTTGTMSGGEQQMVALARAFVAGASLVMVDELSMGLAPRVVEDLFDRLALLAQRGVALIVVEQFVHQALALADTVVVLNRGEIALHARAADFDPSVLAQQYLGAH